MGFFGNLIRNQVGKMVSNAVDDALDRTVGSAIRDKLGQNGHEGTQNFSSSTSSSKSMKVKPGKGSGEKELRRRLEEVFAEEFMGYEVRKDLQAGINGAKNYSYGLYLNGMPRAMIMVCNNGVHHSIKSERLAEQASLSYGVPYMNFFAHLPNEKAYIVERLKSNVL